MIPERLSAYRSRIPLLDEVTEWSLLRQWSLSEVYRVTQANGATRIIKWGGQEMAREASIYRQLVNPLQIKAPYLFGYYEGENSAVMIMEDAGQHNLEQQPSRDHFLEAARELARLRQTASANLERNLSSHTLTSYTISAAKFLKLLDDLLRSPRLSGNRMLVRLQHILPAALDSLYRTVPITLVHHDYHAKNLLIQGNNILPIDWSIAYLSPHLGDLYGLIGEAHNRCGGVPKEEVVSAFLEEAGPELSLEQLHWQVNIGGICWLVKTLRWLVYGGTGTIPGSEEWIPDLLQDLEDLAEQIA
ncbi:phosphotransferase [Paenibacillus sp. GCM10012303]|uniref:phosphotransferase n=1 Tax=Paenibacillus sp. GCM10012303 TaxID=3317340 RepID=UPI00361012AA